MKLIYSLQKNKKNILPKNEWEGIKTEGYFLIKNKRKKPFEFSYEYLLFEESNQDI